jgi:uncharacterized membrane protein YjjB (DUF3815 family)
MEWLLFFEKGIWFGSAALGFAILFNVPPRTLLVVWLLGAAGGLTKLLLIQLGAGVILGSLGGASLIGLLSIPAAHNRHAPPLVFAIPSVIPMVPGIFAYRMILGLIALAGTPGMVSTEQTLTDTFSYGLKVMFILMSLATGVAIPMLITRKSSAKNLKIKKRGR